MSAAAATVVHALTDVAPAPSVVTIGVFDGVHRGHREIIDRAVGRARELDVRAVAVTFDPHPMAVVRDSGPPPLLQPTDDRVAVLARTGVDLVFVLPFDREVAQLSPTDFVDRVLAGALQARGVVVGTNFRFGHRAAGDVDTLADLGEVRGFDVDAVDLLEHDGATVSSTQVRRHLADGDLAWATAALGRPWTYTGTVVAGEGRGRTIGVPTANVMAPDAVLRPGGGVYAARARVADRHWDAVVNVGTRPTFDGHGITVEAHLLGTTNDPADLDLYGVELTLEFLARLRDEQRFDGPDALVAQIRKDVERAGTWFASASTAD